MNKLITALELAWYAGTTESTALRWCRARRGCVAHRNDADTGWVVDADASAALIERDNPALAERLAAAKPMGRTALRALRREMSTPGWLARRRHALRLLSVGQATALIATEGGKAANERRTRRHIQTDRLPAVRQPSGRALVAPTETVFSVALYGLEVSERVREGKVSASDLLAAIGPDGRCDAALLSDDDLLTPDNDVAPDAPVPPLWQLALAARAGQGQQAA